MSYCANCGTPLTKGQAYCGNCGATAPPNAVSATSELSSQADRIAGAAPESASAFQSLSERKSQIPARPRSAIGKRMLALVGAVLVVSGGIVYVRYRAKQSSKARLEQLQGKANNSGRDNSRDASPGDSPQLSAAGRNLSGSTTDDPLSSLLSKLQGGESTSPAGNMMKNVLEDTGVKDPNLPADLIRNIPYTAVKSPLPCPSGGRAIDPMKLASGKIQIKPGTILTSSWSLPEADAETDSIIGSVSPVSLSFQYSGIAAQGLDMRIKWQTALESTVCGKDIEEGPAFSTGWDFHADGNALIAPGLYPGISRIVLPVKRFNSLKETGSTALVFAYYDYTDVLTEWELLAWEGTLVRVEPDDVPFPLIINDERATVPAIHVRGNMKVLENAGRFGSHDQPADAFVLDDPNTPVVLSWMFGQDMKQNDAFRVQYVHVRYPSGEKPVIERQLEKEKKAITWGINFDFNSDEIRPGSESVLKEIADAVAHHPDWKLTIAGHTDNIGGQKYNLELSQRRSASVKRALVERYHVDPNHLATAGYGDSNPIDSNDTLQGRARNRRVELTLD